MRGVIVVWLAVMVLAGVAEGQQEGRPNVLFIVCDDLNTHVSTSDYRPIRTPTFDHLASTGMTVRRAYCQYPVCGPSRAAFLSGLYPESTGVLNNTADLRETRPGTVTLPGHFRSHGYWTAATGKIFHNSKIDPGSAVWDKVYRYDNDELPMVTAAREAFIAENGPVDRQPNRRRWRELIPTLGTQTRGQQRPGYGPSALEDDQHKDGKNALQVISWLRDRPFGEAPFLIACGIQKPHVPFLAPQRYFDMYPLDTLKYSPLVPGDWEDIPQLAMSRRFAAFGFELGVENDRLRREYMQAYHACITFLDAQIGRILSELESQGLADETIVILTSDHGYHLGEHSMWGKVTLFEECARVPLLIRVPGRTEPGSTTDGLVELIDMVPTLTDLCGLPSPEEIQGMSLASLIDDPSGSGRRCAYTVVTRGPQLGRSIRTQRHRYAEWGDPSQAELYDLEADPRELTNLAPVAKYQDVLREMRTLLAETARRAAVRQHVDASRE